MVLVGEIVLALLLTPFAAMAAWTAFAIVHGAKG
jgi:hypothetical protein